MPEDVRPVTSHLFFEKQPHGRSVLPRESTGVFHLPVTPTELALVGPALLELTYPLALELVLHSAIVTDFTMERLLIPFSWERERRAKIINEGFRASITPRPFSSWNLPVSNLVDLLNRSFNLKEGFSQRRTEAYKF